MPPNLPPAATDISKLIARVEQLERLARQRGPDQLQKQDDVSFLNKTNGDVPTFNATTGKWENAPAGGSGFPVGPYDDGTGTHEIQTVAGGGVALINQTTQSDAHAGNIGKLFTGVDDGTLEAVAAATALSADGGLGVVSAQAYDGTQVVTQLTAHAFGTGLPSGIIAVSQTSGNSIINVLGDVAHLDSPFISMANLPTSDPGSPSQLYVDGSGFVKQSP